MQETILTFTKKDDIFNKLYFVVTARSKDESPPVLTCLNVEKGIGACADGFRFHKADFESDAIPDGLYHIKKQTKAKIILSKAVDERYPDLSPFIPLQNDKTKYKEVRAPHAVSYALYAFSRGDKIVNYLLVVDAMKNADNHKLCWNTSIKWSPVMIEHELGIAVIMPLHPPQE